MFSKLSDRRIPSAGPAAARWLLVMRKFVNSIIDNIRYIYALSNTGC